MVVDRDDHVYQPGLLFLPFGLADRDDLVRSRPRQLRAGIGYRDAGVDRVDVEHDRVVLEDGAVLPYDMLVVATGARLLPEETEGLTGPGAAHTFYDLDDRGILEIRVPVSEPVQHRKIRVDVPAE